MAAALVAAATLAACNRGASNESASPDTEGAVEAPTAPILQGAYGVYVTNEQSGDLTPLDRQRMPSSPRFRSANDRVASDGSRLYIALSGSPISPPGVDESTLPPPDRTADGIGAVDVKSFMAFSPDISRAYVTAENGGTVSVVDTASHKVIATIPLTGTNVRPMGVVVSPDGQRVYVTTGRGGTVVAIDAATNTLVGSVDVGPRPWGLAISPDGARLYTANGPSNDNSVVDVPSLTLVTRVPAGRSPWGVAIA